VSQVFSKIPRRILLPSVLFLNTATGCLAFDAFDDGLRDILRNHNTYYGGSITGLRH
jgi:hypothetical protein